MTTARPLPEQSPTQIDTALSDLYYQEGKAEQSLSSARVRIHQAGGSRKNYTGRRGATFTWSQTFEVALAAATTTASNDTTYMGAEAQRALNAMEDATAALLFYRKEMSVLNDEFTRRGGWARAFLVQQPNGHVHKSMACPTCYPTTRYTWMVDYSGQDETQIVEAAGERACTECYRTAPVSALNRPTRMFGPDEITAQAAREERATAKTARNQAKIDKSLTGDGSPFRIEYDHGQRSDGSVSGRSERFATEAAASQWVVGTLADTQWGYTISQSKKVAMDQVIAAIAAKHHVSVEEIRVDIERKVVAKRKRDAR